MTEGHREQSSTVHGGWKVAQRNRARDKRDEEPHMGSKVRPPQLTQTHSEVFSINLLDGLDPESNQSDTINLNHHSKTVR